ncbi:MAG: hypothetical protein VW371_04345 [Bacteroidota bacterium]
MNHILSFNLSLLIVLLISCSGNTTISNEIIEQENIEFELDYTIPIVIEKELKDNHNLDDWSEFLILENNILILANSINGYVENDAVYLEDILNKLSNNSSNILKSEFELLNKSSEIKGRLKLLNIQIQKTKINISSIDKKNGIEELDKIFTYYNYSVNMIQSIINDSSY